jgi:hypothetical protein
MQTDKRCAGLTEPILFHQCEGVQVAHEQTADCRLLVRDSPDPSINSISF